MKKEEFDENARWFMRVWRSFFDENITLVEKKSKRSDVGDWLKGRDRKSPEELNLQLLEQALINDPGNTRLIERIANLKNKLGMWD